MPTTRKRTNRAKRSAVHAIEAFGAAAVGRAAVMAVVLFALLVGVTIVQHLYFRRRISYDIT